MTTDRTRTLTEPPRSISRRLMLGGLVAGSAAVGATALDRGQSAQAATNDWKVFFVEHPGGTPDQTAIQTALDNADSAGGGIVALSEGTWQIEEMLRIYAGTRFVLTPATVLVRSAAIAAILSNGPASAGTDTTTTAFNAPGNIHLEGGIYDVNCDNQTQPSWGIVFAHAKNITVRDVTILNVAEWHAVEFSACYNVAVENSTFIRGLPRTSGPWNTGAVSFDVALAGSTIVPFGAADGTHTQVVRVIGNYCEDWPTFVECHTAQESTPGYSQFVVANNTMKDLSYWGVSLRNVSRAVVIGNTMNEVGGGIWIRPHNGVAVPTEKKVAFAISIANNVIETTRRDEGIYVAGEVDGSNNGKIHNCNISGNMIRYAETDGIRLTYSPWSTVSDNSVFMAKGRALSISNSDFVVASSNNLTGADLEGIYVSGASNHNIASNTVIDSCKSGGGTASAIRLEGVSRPAVLGNKITSNSYVTRTTNAISSDSGCAGVFYTNNDVRWGYVSTAFNMLGSGHISTAGNVT